MNPTLDLLLKRKSVRAYQDRPISQEVKDQILAAAMRAPTAGNMMLYSIIEVRDQAAKDALAISCDHQPFIAKAPLVLLFLADYQRWYDYFQFAGIETFCEKTGIALRRPQEGDLFLACSDALVAAQSAVVAAESLGVGSCYIGDIIENCETHQALFDLPRYVFPIILTCFGYPTPLQQARALTQRFDRRYIVFEDRYRRLDPDELEDMFSARQAQVFGERHELKGAENLGQWMYQRKFASDFAREMTRSVRKMLKDWGDGGKENIEY